ncbi:MAG: hypothetical protein DSY80_06285 [Desulfocapsa sp.]|nr:MAG: hypothetical protein DSY80_06285 [Desulfocapsa sp.]
MNISKFHNAHKNKTILLVGNGANLHLTPPEMFDMPSIGMNTIHLYRGWMPDYYVTVDRRVYREFGEAINKKYAKVIKFVPAPRLAKWTGENVYHFRHYQGLLYPKNRRSLWQDDISTEPIIYGNVMHVAIKLAYFMGAKKILIIGMEHKPHKSNAHFWGDDRGMSADQVTKDWQAGYKILANELKKRKVKLLNISEKTFVAENIIPKDNWEKYVKKEK